MRHEQTREDRDQFVKILWDNIEPDHKFNFDNTNIAAIANDFGAYDFQSVMHYKSTAFGKKVDGHRLQTIKNRANPDDQSFGLSTSLSATDINAINAMYPESSIPCPELSVLAPGELAVGASKTISVRAGRANNLTGVFVRNGQKYRFTTTSPAWNNGSKETDCNGYEGSIVYLDVPRHSDLNMMALAGEIYRNADGTNYTNTYFRIGCGPRTHTVQNTGFLAVFANDNAAGYGNNSRVVTLTIHRLL